MPLRGDDEKIVGIFGISRDITEHRKHELLNSSSEQMESELELGREVQHSFLESPVMHLPASERSFAVQVARRRVAPDL
jgi:hypothetical protein